MHPRLAELAGLVTRNRKMLLAGVDGVPMTLLNRKPDPNCWSVAEILDHLYLVESGIARLIHQRASEARDEDHPEETETSSLLHSIDHLHVVQRDNPREVPPAVRPREGVHAGDALASLAASHAALQHALQAADGLALGLIRHTHPLYGDLTLYEWVLFLAQHEARHSAQITEILRRLGSQPQLAQVS